MQRYKELKRLVTKLQPEKILEIGTWKGHRAISLCEGLDTFYVGFDLFQDGNEIIDRQESNGKGRSHLAGVDQALTDRNIRHELIKGNTNITLPEYINYTSHKFDFAFIDGGHSVETIENDWLCVKQLMNEGGVVVFDDYYQNMNKSFIDRFGANRVLEKYKLNYELSNSIDPVTGGGQVRTVKIL